MVSVKEAIELRGAFTFEEGITLQPDVHFAAGLSVRESLPDFGANAIVEGSLPDPTFNGLLRGLTGGELELGLLKMLPDTPLAPKLRSPHGGAFDEPVFECTAIRGKTYSLQRSEDLVSWIPVNTVIAQSNTAHFIDVEEGWPADSFYRVVRADRPRHVDSAMAYELNGTSGRHYDFVPSRALWFRWRSNTGGSIKVRANRQGISWYVPEQDGSLTWRSSRWDRDLYAHVLEVTAGQVYYWKVSDSKPKSLVLEWGPDLLPID